MSAIVSGFENHTAYPTPREADANACLIAASPDLLAGCKAMLSYMESGFLVRNTKDDHKTDWVLRSLPFVKDVQAMHAAIKKAEGGTP